MEKLCNHSAGEAQSGFKHYNFTADPVNGPQDAEWVKSRSSVPVR